MVSNSFRFATKVWLTSVFASPLVFLLLNWIAYSPRQSFDALGISNFFLFSIVFGLVFSLPSWTVFIFCVKYLNRLSVPSFKKKAFIIIAAIILTYLPFYLIFYKDDIEQQISNFKFATAYCLTIVIGILVYKLLPDNPTREVSV